MPTKSECIKRVMQLTAGVSPHHFQQNHEEVGQVVQFLLQQPEQLRSYFEIGAGSGHVARVYDSFFHFERIYLIDDDRHYHGRLTQVPKAVEWIGDSTSQAAIDTLGRWKQRFDLIHIDGDHAFESVKADTYLALRCVANPCYVMFHDARHGDVRRWLAKLRAGKIEELAFLELFGRKSDGKKNLALFKFYDPDWNTRWDL